MGRDLLHPGGGGAGPGVELVDEEAGEAVLPDQLQRLLEVRLRLSREAADDVRGDGYTGNPGRHRGNAGVNQRVPLSFSLCLFSFNVLLIPFSPLF